MPGAATLRDCKELKDMVEKQAADGRFYAAICAAPAVALGSWGLLKGLKVRSAAALFLICQTASKQFSLPIESLSLCS